MAIKERFFCGGHSYVKEDRYTATNTATNELVRIYYSTKVLCKERPKMQCKEELMADPDVQVYPRSCAICGLGPCKKEKQNMKFNIITKATIGKSAIEQILKDAIEKETGLKIKTMRFNITKQYDMRNEVSGEAVSGLDVEFETK